MPPEVADLSAAAKYKGEGLVCATAAKYGLFPRYIIKSNDPFLSLPVVPIAPLSNATTI
jgi:hypothetical protein